MLYKACNPSADTLRQNILGQLLKLHTETLNAAPDMRIIFPILKKCMQSYNILTYYCSIKNSIGKHWCDLFSYCSLAQKKGPNYLIQHIFKRNGPDLKTLTLLCLQM
jgi:hypothetical protein